MKPIDKILISPFQMEELLECEVKKTANNHITAHICGYIKSDEKDILDVESFVINATDEDENIIRLFNGIVNNISLEVIGGIKKMTVEGVSRTALLDTQKRTCTYQYNNQIYRDLVNLLSERNKDMSVIYAPCSKQDTGGMIVQYQETDWEFLKRLASRLQTNIIPDCTNDKICLFFGVPLKKMKGELSYNYYKRCNTLGLKSFNTSEISLESRDVVPLCTPVDIDGRIYLVYEILSQFLNGEFIHKYILRISEEFKSLSYENSQVIGVSMIGTVEEVINQFVRISILDDLDYNGGDGKWFPYATVYASQGDAAWYCMPEPGDSVRVYFPDAIADHAYVVSSIHLGETNDLRKNPDEKSFRTIYNKELRFTKEKILITNHKGLSITLDDKKGIMIKSNKLVSLSAQDGIELESDGAVQIHAQNGIILRQNENSLVLKDGIRQSGLNVRLR